MQAIMEVFIYALFLRLPCVSVMRESAVFFLDDFKVQSAVISEKSVNGTFRMADVMFDVVIS